MHIAVCPDANTDAAMELQGGTWEHTAQHIVATTRTPRNISQSRTHHAHACRANPHIPQQTLLHNGRTWKHIPHKSTKS
eukprot:7214782-Alexandrium_andersonii.AAC.2